MIKMLSMYEYYETNIWYQYKHLSNEYYYLIVYGGNDTCNELRIVSLQELVSYPVDKYRILDCNYAVEEFYASKNCTE